MPRSVPWAMTGGNDTMNRGIDLFSRVGNGMRVRKGNEGASSAEADGEAMSGRRLILPAILPCLVIASVLACSAILVFNDGAVAETADGGTNTAGMSGETLNVEHPDDGGR